MPKDTIDARNRHSLEGRCLAARGLSRISGRWKLSLLVHLGKGAAGLPALQVLLPQASGRVLTRALRQMQADGLILRAAQGQSVQYHLTPAGAGLLRIIDDLAEWQGRNP